MVAVMRALTHSRVSTTQKYLDNNLLNAERDGQFVSFVGNLFLLINSSTRIDMPSSDSLRITAFSGHTKHR